MTRTILDEVTPAQVGLWLMILGLLSSSGCASRDPDKKSAVGFNDSVHQWTSIDSSWSGCTDAEGISAVEFPPFPRIFRLSKNTNGPGYLINSCSESGTCSESTAYGSVFHDSSSSASEIELSAPPPSDATFIGTPIVKWKSSGADSCVYTVTSPDLRRGLDDATWLLRVRLEQYREPRVCDIESFRPTDGSPHCKAERSAVAEILDL